MPLREGQTFAGFRIGLVGSGGMEQVESPVNDPLPFAEYLTGPSPTLD
ncbi:hypothetical protein [Mycobacterium simiae]|nr:hypothetical protein [Mycobacterium simiae]